VTWFNRVSVLKLMILIAQTEKLPSHYFVIKLGEAH